MTQPVIIGDATLHLGDCMEVMRGMADASVDAIVTDPPYHLKSNSGGPTGTGLNSPHARSKAGASRGGFMGQEWDGGDIAFRPELWREALRVIKPGGHLLAFSGTRTYHRMACAIEDAGFEVRDQIGWLYGSGFPKSLDVSKAIDKAEDYKLQAAYRRAYVEAVQEAGLVLPGNTRHDWTIGEHAPGNTWWAEFESWLPGLSYNEREKIERIVIGKGFKPRPTYHTQDIGGNAVKSEYDIIAPVTEAAQQWQGWGTALKPAWEPICVARKPLIGTVAANVLQFGTGALNIDACRISTDEELRSGTGGTWDKMHEHEGRSRDGELSAEKRYGDKGGTNFAMKPGVRGGNSAGRWPANVIHDGSDEVMDAFAQFGDRCVSGSAKNGTRSEAVAGGQVFAGPRGQGPLYNDAGTAARFYYCAKASRHDRNEGCESFEKKPLNWSSGTQNPGSFQAEGTDKTSQNFHPTVKPTDLMAYLCRLVTPPGGIVFDPFMGSGSTGKACVREGFRFIGIEKETDYLAIAKARIEHEAKKPRQAGLFDVHPVDSVIPQPASFDAPAEAHIDTAQAQGEAA